MDQTQLARLRVLDICRNLPPPKWHLFNDGQEMAFLEEAVRLGINPFHELEHIIICLFTMFLQRELYRNVDYTMPSGSFC